MHERVLTILVTGCHFLTVSSRTDRAPSPVLYFTVLYDVSASQRAIDYIVHLLERGVMTMKPVQCH